MAKQMGVRERLAEIYKTAAPVAVDEETDEEVDEEGEEGEDEEGEEGEDEEVGEVDLSQVPTEELQALAKQANLSLHMEGLEKLAEESGVPMEKLAEAHLLGMVMSDAIFDRKMWRYKQAGLITDDDYLQICLASGGTVYDEEFTPVDVENP